MRIPSLPMISILTQIAKIYGVSLCVWTRLLSSLLILEYCSEGELTAFTKQLNILLISNLLLCYLSFAKANEELRSIFPLYNEISNTGNALERVLALEMELAEALRAKHQSKSHFQR